MGKEGEKGLESAKKKKNLVHKGKDLSSVNPFWSSWLFICGELTKTDWMAALCYGLSPHSDSEEAGARKGSRNFLKAS